MAFLAQPDIQEFELPSSTPDDIVTVEVDMTVYGGQAEDTFDEFGRLRAPVSSILATAIKKWSFVDKEGATPPITQENVRHLRAEDFNFLSEKVLQPLNVIATAQVSPTEKKA